VRQTYAATIEVNAVVGEAQIGGERARYDARWNKRAISPHDDWCMCFSRLILFRDVL